MARVFSFIILGVVCLVIASGQMASAQSSVRAPENAVNITPEDGAPNTLGTRSDGEMWYAIRLGEVGNASSSSATGRSIQTLGQDWRALRENYIVKYSWYFPLGVIGLIVLFYAIRGRMPIEAGRSGKTLPRFTLVHRIAHWFMAGVFLILGISGLIILLGRPLIAPVFGLEVNSILTSAALQGHNLFGPMFIFGLVWMFIKFVPGNIFQMVDFKWILGAGGLFGGHVSSHEFNFGEKTWFWILMLVGIVMSVTGLALLFPWFTMEVDWLPFIQGLEILQLSTILHAIGAIILICVAIGHMYIGSIGMEGALDSMLRGEVDENWAKEHHDLWYEKVTGKSAHEEKTEEGDTA